MQAFFDVMQDRKMSPEERAEILINGTSVCKAGIIIEDRKDM